MTITNKGSVGCGNCGSEKWTAPQIKDNPEGGADLFMCCVNCGQPQFVLHEDDADAVKELAHFFVQASEESE